MNYIKSIDIDIIDNCAYVTIDEPMAKLSNTSLEPFATKIFSDTRICFDLEMFKIVFENYTIVEFLEIDKDEFLKICKKVKSFYERNKNKWKIFLTNI